MHFAHTLRKETASPAIDIPRTGKTGRVRERRFQLRQPRAILNAGGQDARQADIVSQIPSASTLSLSFCGSIKAGSHSRNKAGILSMIKMHSWR